MQYNIISIFKDLYKSTDVPYLVTLEKSLNRIKKGSSKELVHKIRSGQNELKNKLPSIVFAGEFTERKKDGLKTHSGLMVVDFDKVQNINAFKNELIKNNHFIALFISPSGNGIKGVVKVPKCTAKEHERYFKEFNKKFNYPYFDISGCNIDRVCFESHDPDIFINYDAVTFDPVLIEDGFEVKNKVPLVPITNEDKIIEKIMAFDWKSDFIEGQRNVYIFNLAGAFCEYGINQHYATDFIISHILNDADFSEHEATNTIKSAYKKRGFGVKYFEDYKRLNLIKNDVKNGKDSVLKKHKIDEQTYLEISKETEVSTFWFYDNKNNLKVNPFYFRIFLERNGFKKYYANKNAKPSFVKVISNKVSETTSEQIKDFVLNYLLELQEIDVWNYCVNYGNLFSDSFLNMLESIELLMTKDKKDCVYLAFKNGILEIKKDKICLIDYIDLDGYIWENSIIKNDFKISKEENDYKKFIYNISNKEPLATECVIGYLLTNYKDKTNNKAIILNDEVISENPEGGTGKGLFVQGLKNIRKTHIIDGKSYNDKANFQNQSVSLDDEIVVFDDVPKNFNFENIFSLITEGMTIRHLYKDPVKLSVEDSPKIIISTNYAIKGEGNSHDRRRHEVEISQYYNGKLTPFDEFGKQLFEDWGDEEFNYFYNYMVNCIQKYLNNGLIKQNAKNIKLRKLIAETSFEFLEFIEDVEYIRINERFTKQDVFENFIKVYPDFKNWLRRKAFNIWVKKYCVFKNFKYTDGVTLNDRWFMIEDGNKIEIDEVGMPF